MTALALWRAIATGGQPLILDESLSDRGLVEALRAQGFNVRSVRELFRRFGVKDKEIAEFAEAINARVITLDRGNNDPGGFERRAIAIDERARSPQSIKRVLESKGIKPTP